MAKNDRRGLAFTLSIGGTISACVLAVFILLLATLSWPPWGDLLIDEKGAIAEALVVSDPVPMNDSYGVLRERVLVDVRLQQGPNVGKRIEFTAAPTYPIYANARIVVEYLPEGPEIARMEGGQYARFDLKILGWLTLGVLLSISVLLSGWLIDAQSRNQVKRPSRR